MSEEDLLRLYLSKKRINILRYVGPEDTRTMIRADTKLENIEVRVSDRKFESARLENAAAADDLLLDGTLMDLEAFKAFLEVCKLLLYNHTVQCTVLVYCTKFSLNGSIKVH